MQSNSDALQGAHYHFDQLLGHYDEYRVGVIESQHAFVCHHWRRSDAKRSALVVHGLFDHVGLFLPLVKYLLTQSYNVISVELPDHGLSPQKYGSLANFKQYSQAIADLFNSPQITISTPVSALGQSTGGAVLFDYLSSNAGTSKVDQLVLLAPLLRVRSWRLIRISYFLLHLFLKKVPRGFAENSHDPRFSEFLEHHDPLQPKFVSVDWVGAMLDWERAFHLLAPVETPTLLIQGTDDNTVAHDFNVPMYAEKLPNLRVEMVEGAFHHLVGEADPWRFQVFDLVGQFLAKAESS